jgi:CubicO group peptidase (beta-lactamase class C family)
MMLERVSGRAYKELLSNVGNDMGIDFGFGRPNASDSLQTWGHNAALTPEASVDDGKLEWLLAAGNINCTLPDYTKFIQQQLRGLRGQSDLLSQEQFQFLFFGRSRFSMGWFPGADSIHGRYAWNIGNPGTFLTKVYVFPEANRAYILFSNAQTDAAETGLNILYDKLEERYSR